MNWCKMEEVIIIPGKRLLNNNELDYEGKQRIHALFRYLRPLYPENIIEKEHEKYYERRDVKYIIFSGGITKNRKVSEARVMFDFFLKHALEETIKDSFDSKTLKNENNKEYLVKLNQILGGKVIWIFLDEDSSETNENRRNAQKIISQIQENNNKKKLQKLYITQKYHSYRFDDVDGENTRLLFAEKIMGENYQKTPNIEYFFRFIKFLKLDKVGLARSFWNKIKFFIKK